LLLCRCRAQDGIMRQEEADPPLRQL